MPLEKRKSKQAAEFIAIADPSGTGEILGPKLFEEYALPALNRICEELKPLCKGVIVHICGQLRTIYPQLAKLKCSGLSVDAGGKHQGAEKIFRTWQLSEISAPLLWQAEMQLSSKICVTAP